MSNLYESNLSQIPNPASAITRDFFQSQMWENGNIAFYQQDVLCVWEGFREVSGVK